MNLSILINEPGIAHKHKRKLTSPMAMVTTQDQEGFTGGNTLVKGPRNEQTDLNESYNGCIVSGGSAGGGSGMLSGKGLKVPPFLNKAYEMVSNPETDVIISWTTGGTTFTVWDHHMFSKEILPKYFRHDNFSSFIYQLNNYGFKKTNFDQWEYGNEWFQLGKEHLLVNIKRKNQIPPIMKRNRGVNLCANSANMVLEAHIQKQGADQNQLRLEVEKLMKRQEAMENGMTTTNEKLESLFRQIQIVICMASAFIPKYAQQSKKHVRQEDDKGETAKKTRVETENTECAMDIVDVSDDSRVSVKEKNLFASDAKEDAVSEIDNVVSSDCGLLESLMTMDENEAQGKVANKQPQMELEDWIGTPSEWGYMKEFVDQMEFKDKKPAIPLGGEAKVV